MRKQQLSAEDLKLLRAYFTVRTANPCSRCAINSATCCGCKEQSEWLKKFTMAEKLIKDIDNRVRVLFETYSTQVATIKDLKNQQEQVTQALVKTCDELAEYLDVAAMQEAGFT